MDAIKVCRNPIVLVMMLTLALEKYKGGVTSDFVRASFEIPDMLMDSDVFRTPPSYNVPQQVFFHQNS